MSKSLMDIRACYLPMFKELWDKKQEHKLVRLCELSEKMKKAPSNLLVELGELEKDRCVNRYEHNGEILYGVGMFGEVIIGLEDCPQEWFFVLMGIWNSIFEEWRLKNGN